MERGFTEHVQEYNERNNGERTVENPLLYTSDEEMIRKQASDIRNFFQIFTHSTERKQWVFLYLPLGSRKPSEETGARREHKKKNSTTTNPGRAEIVARALNLRAIA